MPEHGINPEDRQWMENTLHLIAEEDLNAAMEKISSYSIDTTLQPVKLHLFGLLSVRLQNFVEALNFFKKASDLAPLSKIHFEAASYCAAKLGMLSDSLFYLKMSATCPEPTAFELDFLPAWMGSVEAQLANIQERPFFEKARWALAQGKYAETLHDLQQALNADPFHVESWLLIQKVMKRLDRKYDSIQAVKAALDSGPVAAGPLAEAALCAAELGLAESESLFDKAYANCNEDDRGDVDLCLMEALSSQTGGGEAYERRKAEYLTGLNDVAPSDTIVPLDNQVNLGIFSGRLNAGMGTDFFVNFMLDVCLYNQMSWLAIRVFSNTDIDDFQTGRLQADVRDFRSVAMVDPLTLSRILRNERIHFLWDFDGLRPTGAPQIHQETMVPDRLILDETAEPPRFVSLVGDTSDPLPIMPIAFPRTFDPETFNASGFSQKKATERRTILISLHPCELSVALLEMLAKVKSKAPFFDLSLDTRKLGGVSFVDAIEEKFSNKGLANYIRFNEVGEYPEEYSEEIYAKADYVLLTSGKDSLQPLYDGMLHNCNILAYAEGPNKLVKACMNQLGLQERFFENMGKMKNCLLQELNDPALFEKSLKKQNDALSEYSSPEKRRMNAGLFVQFVEESMRRAYGDDHVAQALEGCS